MMCTPYGFITNLYQFLFQSIGKAVYFFKNTRKYNNKIHYMI